MQQTVTKPTKPRRKSGVTRIGTLEKLYKTDFHARPDMKLSTWLKRNGVPSLGKALELLDKKGLPR